MNSERILLNFIISKGISSVSVVFSTFMLNLWLFDKTNSYIIFVTNTIVTSLVPLFFSIPSGFISDKYNRVFIIIISELLIILCLLLFIFFVYIDYFNPVIYVVVIILQSIANEFKYTAITALIPEISSKDNIIKYNGIQQGFRGASIILGPVLGCVSYMMTKIEYALFLSVSAQIYSILTLANISIVYKSRGQAIFKDEFSYLYIIKWILGNSELRRVLLSFSYLNAIMSAYMAIITPYLLNNFNKLSLTIFVISEGMGLMFSGYLIIRIRIRKIYTWYKVFSMLLGIAIFLMGILNDLYFICFLGYLTGMCIGIIATTNQTIWQRYTPNEIQGKIISVRTIFLYMLSPIAVYCVVPLTGIIEYLTKNKFNWIHDPMSMTISFLGLLILIISILDSNLKGELYEM